MAGWVEALKFRKVEVSIIANRRELSENHSQVKPIILPMSSSNLLRILPMSKIWSMKLSSPKMSIIKKELQKISPNKIVVRFELDLTSVKFLIAARLRHVPIFVYTQWPVIKTPLIKKVILITFVRLLKMPTFSPVFRYGNSLIDFEKIGIGNKIEFDQEMKNRLSGRYLVKWIPFTLSASNTITKATLVEKQRESIFQFITIGKFVNRKNLSMIIETFCKNRRFMKSSSELMVIGECTTEQHNLVFADLTRMLQIYDASHKIHLVRNLSHDEVQNFLRKSQVFLLQSLDEPASVSILEAMGNANLLILNPASGTADYAGDNYGSLASTSEVDLDECINKVLNDKAFVQLIQARNEQTYDEYFSNKVVGDHLYNFLFKKNKHALLS